MSETIIKADRVAKSFSHLTILENVCFEVNQGDRYGLVGLNGAGKTTLIRLLLGVLKPSRGTLSVLGIDPWFHDPAQLQRMGVVLEHDGFWGNLTFDQNMRIFAEAKGIARNQAMAYIDQYWSTTSLYRNKKPVKLFSRGQRMLCAIARAFMGWPKVYFFDEPAVALDVGAYDHFRGLVKTATSQGATFFISSHQLEAIDDLCDRVGMLRNRCITELDLGAQNNGKEQWALGAANEQRWAAIIRDICASEPRWENGEWRFNVDDSETLIPRLIKCLVEAGCGVRRVAPIETGFSDTIRKTYHAHPSVVLPKDRRD